ncbi:hypothetical protein EYF80_019307 [Liparis tanakae]|uniref:Secreted protein n=1 Tax=Liparis tanakae TaxID=230148 RepID=A0A4Z2HY19_9TELE|nr:hypothetical protein EYF80_019307 [Liparis tanakae]
MCGGSLCEAVVFLVLPSEAGATSGRDVRNMQRRAVIIICAPHRRGPPCAPEDREAPRGAAARSAEPVVRETPAEPTTDS